MHPGALLASITILHNQNRYGALYGGSKSGMHWAQSSFSNAVGTKFRGTPPWGKDDAQEGRYR
jgi:hypothetical protein